MGNSFDLQDTFYNFQKKTAVFSLHIFAIRNSNKYWLFFYLKMWTSDSVSTGSENLLTWILWAFIRNNFFISFLMFGFV